MAKQRSVDRIQLMPGWCCYLDW